MGVGNWWFLFYSIGEFLNLRKDPGLILRKLTKFTSHYYFTT